MLPLQKVAIDVLTQLDDITGLTLFGSQLEIARGVQNVMLVAGAQKGKVTLHDNNGPQRNITLAAAYKAIGLKKGKGKQTETDETDGDAEGTE